ncbi:hypothetical protein CEXT_428541 [Caerostris extrusa]|uniref:Uncharacterized protein n=1 Tax=Caerostris extrusa TaxID=172846 RepID=A0AAV4R6N4_CAEEX|nr:hypothetical protein CEXT_428541 [Caerostris extrusa]
MAEWLWRQTKIAFIKCCCAMCGVIVDRHSENECLSETLRLRLKPSSHIQNALTLTTEFQSTYIIHVLPGWPSGYGCGLNLLSSNVICSTHGVMFDGHSGDRMTEWLWRQTKIAFIKCCCSMYGVMIDVCTGLEVTNYIDSCGIFKFSQIENHDVNYGTVLCSGWPSGYGVGLKLLFIDCIYPMCGKIVN